MTPESSAPSTGYRQELKLHSRALFAASAGLASGFLLNHYVANIFGPRLVEAFGWSRSQFALVGAFGLINLATIPLVGRLTDKVGARPVAAVGVVAFPLTFLAFSQMQGSFTAFVLISIAQYLLCGATTTSIVYSRLIAERFLSARGLALAVGATAPALIGMAGSPLLQMLINSQGWRAGYIGVAAYVAIVGALALILMPSQSPERRAASKKPGMDRAGYRQIFRNRTFWLLFFGFLLCNLIYPLQSSQMTLMLAEQGVTAERAAWMISLFAGGVLAGRFLCGLALDRFPSHLVAALSLGLPSFGLLAIASGFGSPMMLGAAVVVMGLSLGAESDLAAYLVMKHFDLRIYGTVLSLVVTALALSASIGSMVLSATLAMSGTFTAYLMLSAAACVVGAFFFLMLGSASGPTTEITASDLP